MGQLIIQIGAEIRIKDPTPQLKKWCDENLVIRNPEYDDRMRRGLWTGKTPEYLWLFRVDGQDLVIPTWDRKGDPEVFNEQDLIEIHLADRHMFSTMESCRCMTTRDRRWLR